MIKYESLIPLVGVDLKIAKTIFCEFISVNTRGYNKEIGGIAEDLIAVSFDVARPTNKKGSDFDELGDSKSVKSRLIKRTTFTENQVNTLVDIGIKEEDVKKHETIVRECGNPIISSLENKVDFFDTNVWAKMKKLILVYHVDNIIQDIRVFDSEQYKYILESDYKLIEEQKYKETKILTLKLKTGLIQIKKNLAHFLSKSIVPDNFKLHKITDQKDYINDLFLEKLPSYKERKRERREKKVTFEDVKNYNYSGDQMEEMIEHLSKLLKEHKSIIPDDNLTF